MDYNYSKEDKRFGLAVFGGIKGRQQKGLKVNPVYDSNHGNTPNPSQDINGNISNVQVVTYTSIPDSHSTTTEKQSANNEVDKISKISKENGHRNPRNDHTDSNGNIDNSIASAFHSDNDINMRPIVNLSEASTYVTPNRNKNTSLDISYGNQGSVGKSIDMSDYEIKVNMTGNENKQVKEDFNKNGIVLGVNGIVGKNGSVKREKVVIECHSITTKPLAVPVHLGKLDKSKNDNQDTIVEDKNMKNKMLEKRGSGYELLSYNNEGYIADESSIHLETIDYTNKDNAHVEGQNKIEPESENDNVQNICKQANPCESEKETEESDYKSISKKYLVDSQYKVNEKSNAGNDGDDLVESASSIVRTTSSFSSTSVQSVKTEIITEVHVHREDINQNHNYLNSAYDSLASETKPKLESNVGNSQTEDSAAVDAFNSDIQEVTDLFSVIDNLDNLEVASVPQGNDITSVTHTDDDSPTQVKNIEGSTTQIHKHVDEINDAVKDVKDKEWSNYDNEEVSESSKSVAFSTAETTKESVSNGYKTNSSSTRTLKSILLTSNGKYNTPADSPNNDESDVTENVQEIHEIKTVKFSEDTVFNENKSKRYRLDKMEKINLREIYRGKISCDSAIAKMNPIFHDDMDSQDIEKSMSEDEKIAYQIALRKMMKSTGKGKDPTSPAYRDHYLILKANGIGNSAADGIQTDIEQPAYDRLIQRTIAKERRKLIVKWVLVILVVAIVTTIATVLGVHFK